MNMVYIYSARFILFYKVYAFQHWAGRYCQKKKKKR